MKTSFFWGKALYHRRNPQDVSPAQREGQHSVNRSRDAPQTAKLSYGRISQTAHLSRQDYDKLDAHSGVLRASILLIFAQYLEGKSSLIG